MGPRPRPNETQLLRQRRRITEGIKGVWYRFDNQFLKPHFGGEDTMATNRERLESQQNNDNDFFISDNAKKEYELGNISVNKVVGKTQTGLISNQKKCMEEEMISLTRQE